MAFHLHRDGTSTTFAVAELRDMARRGDLPQDEYVYVDEKGEWLAAGQLPELTGAWHIEENEATVAEQLTPEMLASIAGLNVLPAAHAALPGAGAAADGTASAHAARPVSGMHPSAPNATHSGLTRAPDRPGAIAANAQQADETHDDSVPTTFMQLPEQLKGVAPAPSKSALRNAAQPEQAVQPAKVVLNPEVSGEDEATAFLNVLPELHAPAPTANRALPTAPLQGASPKMEQAGTGTRDAQTALLLSIAGGIVGIDRFYLGYRGLGIIKLLTLCAVAASWLVALPLVAQLAISSVPLLWWIADIVLIATGKLNDAHGKPLKR